MPADQYTPWMRMEAFYVSGGSWAHAYGCELEPSGFDYYSPHEAVDPVGKLDYLTSAPI